MTGFAHDMPFGAALLPDGSVRFRLWAPSQHNVSIVLNDSRFTAPMEPKGNGWFELVTDAAGAGTRYQFQLPAGTRVPDPASRQQVGDVHGASLVVDPGAYHWRTSNWQGRPWGEVVLYELHVGAFSADGDLDGVCRKLDWLARQGITAIELMPLSSFAGQRNWGYDGVLPFAPDGAYGSPETLKHLIDAAHERNLMMFLDVVYNHFGPEGNYLRHYAPQFFTDRHQTPWGAAIDFTHPEVRNYFINNALYWLNEYRFDGLRFDAVHAIIDDGPTHILTALAESVRAACNTGRHIHLVLENDANLVRFLTRPQEGTALHYDAQWNDDFHHVAHVLLTGESEGYYADYVDDPQTRLGRALAEGFIYQGEVSRFRHGAIRGETSRQLPAPAFVDFLQNHDQIGNRAFGERLSQLTSPQALEALTAILLLAPQIPLIFMGDDWGETRPFQFFCDYADELATAVRNGRRREFSRFATFSDPERRDRIPDPNAPETFLRSKLDWSKLDLSPHRERSALYRELLMLRRREIIPRLARLETGKATYDLVEDSLLRVIWPFVTGGFLSLLTRLSGTPGPGIAAKPSSKLLYSTHPEITDGGIGQAVPAWFVAWHISDENSRT